jgi:hypothetical protein
MSTNLQEIEPKTIEQIRKEGIDKATLERIAAEMAINPCDFAKTLTMVWSNLL